MKLLHYYLIKMSVFKKNLRAELDYQGLTVKELAAKSSIPKGALDCYLGTQSSIPSAEAAVKIAQALSVSVEYLITGQKLRHSDTLLSLCSEARTSAQIIEQLAENNRKIALALIQALKSRDDAENTHKPKPICHNPHPIPSPA
jgi:transcriptional regulator with XRE-family HTH domain